MSLTDPFNRVSRKRETEYLALRDQLKQAGLDTEEEARAALQNSRGRMLGFGAIVVVIALFVSLIWPNLAGIVIVFGTLILVWLVITMARGQRMMERFIQQELAGKE